MNYHSVPWPNDGHGYPCITTHLVSDVRNQYPDWNSPVVIGLMGRWPPVKTTDPAL